MNSESEKASHEYSALSAGSGLDPMRQTMASWSRSQRNTAIAVAILITAAFAGYATYIMGDPYHIPDAFNYLRIAEGHTPDVPLPFASRQMGAQVVHGLSLLLHISVRHAFVLQGGVALLIMALWVFHSAARTHAPRWLMATFCLLCLWKVLLHSLVLPDLWYSLLLCGFLALLERNRLLLAALCMFPLMLSRESTSLTLLCFLIAAWRFLNWRGILLAIVSTAAGSFLIGRVTANLKNPEHLPQSLYMLGKIPWNAVRLTGIVPWTNLYTGLCDTPTWQRSLHLGPVHAIGYCSYSAENPIVSFDYGCAMLGLLPLLAFFLLRARGWKLGNSVILRFAVIYGVISFVLAPFLGTAYDRLFGYAWPLAVVAVPRLFVQAEVSPAISARAFSRPAALLFLALHCLVCIMGIVFGRSLLPYVILVQAIAVVIATVLLARVFPRPSAPVAIT